MLAEPQSTAADLQFELLGIRIRVSAWFWLAAGLLGWSVCQSFSLGDQRTLLQMLAIWIGVVFVSLLVHEMGHALAYRRFGQSAEIVLYHFGGLAIPTTWGRRHLKPAQRLLVAAAGPLAQFSFAALVVVMLKVAGYAAPFPIPAISSALGLYAGRDFSSPLVYALFDFVLYVNVFWPLLNLIPVPPLDGGQIVRVVVGGAVAWWGYTRGQPFLGIMFAMLAASCFQGLSAGDVPWKRWN